MSWASLFDLGACTVAVTLGDGTPLWSGTMGLGATQLVDAAGSVPSFTVAVDATGKVSLAFGADGVGDGASYSLRVIPQYPHDYPARARDIASNAAGVAVGDGNAPPYDSDGTTYLAYYAPGNTNDYWPDPMDVSGLTGARQFVGVTVSTVAS